MKKYIFSSVIFLFATLYIHAQKTIWGSAANGGDYGYGYIFRTDSVGNNLHIAHSFNFTDGQAPGNLLQASNGKLYGLTNRGGNGDSNIPGTAVGGVFFEYDPIIDSLRVLYHFDTGNAGLPYEGPYASHGVIEVNPGIFYGILSNSRVIFKYNTNTQTASLLASAPTFVGGAFNTTQSNSYVGPLYKASNGFVYVNTLGNSSCPIGMPIAGTFIRINTATETQQTVYINPCNISEGWQYKSPNLEYNGKLYSVAAGGEPSGIGGSIDPGKGVLYEFNPSTNTYTKKVNFTSSTGYFPSTMIKADNGLFYGTADGGTAYSFMSYNFPSGSGTVYKYNPGTNVLSGDYEFRYNSYTIDSVGIYGSLSLKASNGKLYGVNDMGIFEYNTAISKAKPRARVYNGGLSALTEICRKPAYKNYNSTYTVCAGSAFSVDLQNDNATSVVWKKNGAVQASQTSSELHFTNITTADAGTWTSTLTNACGTTTPPAIQITVNPAGSGTITSVLSPSTISICEGSNTTLSGNNGGTWNTGSSSASINVSAAGEYQVTNVNACGNTYSNIITVSYIPTTVNPVANLVPATLCEGGNMTITGNVNGGVWNTGASSTNITVPVAANTPYYIINSHTCGFDTSNIISIGLNSIVDTSGMPQIFAAGPTTFCQSGSVILSSNYIVNPSATWFWYHGSNAYSANGLPITANEAGDYILVQNISQCGIMRYDTLTIGIDQPLVAPTITAQGPISFCEGGSVVLQSNQTHNTWNTNDTTAAITVQYSGVYNISNQNSCGTVTSNDISVTVNPIPSVSFQAPVIDFCTTGAPITLTGGTPVGGIYSGNGVSGGTFNPAAAGVGMHVITYTYTDPNGCSASATKTFTVASLQNPVLTTSSATNSFCQGGVIVLLQFQFQEVQWNTGANAPAIPVYQPGNYYFTVNNACGLQTSNTVTVTMNPIPTVSYMQTPNSICGSTGSITLSAATPAGGVYTGSGVSGNIFNPILAGAGIHNITYSYTENGCTGSALQTITVGTDTAYITPLSSTTFCDGDSVVLQGNSNNGLWSTNVTAPSITVYQSGNYTVTNNSTCGNVTSQSIQVNVIQNTGSNNPQHICFGDSYSINGHTYTNAGTYEDVFVGINGCDSIVTTQLNVMNLISYQNIQTICSGESYTINGHTYSTAGNYNDIFTSVDGCDSTVTTQLTVKPDYSSVNPQTICEGETYEINGHTYSSNGSYSDLFQSIFGCDSVVTTLLTVTDINIAVTQNGNILSALQANADYQWINCDNGTPIANADEASYTATANGNYAVIITYNNCVDTSACFEVKDVSIHSFDIEENISIYPNPTSDVIHIYTGKAIESVVIYNAVGQQVLSANNTKLLQVSALAPGTYFVGIKAGGKLWHGRFVKM